MAYNSISNASPYRQTGQTSWYTGRYVHRAVPPSSDDQQVILDSQYAMRPDKLSFDLYGTWEYWWVFMVRNPSEISHPLFDMRAGMLIMVPSAARIAALFGG